jgi:hypothetical protein
MDKKQLVKLVSAFTMADGGLYRRVQGNKETSKANAYFAMNMLAKHDDYIQWVKSTIECITSCSEREFINESNSPKLMKNLCSKTHPFLTDIWNRVYIDGYKGLDPHAMKMFDFEMLAIFYMADGSLHVEQPNPKKGLVNPSPNVTLNMKRLSYGDQLFLKKLCKEVLGLEFNILKQNYKGKLYYYMRLRNKDIEVFMKGIEPYMLPSFSYKLYDSERKTPKG